MDKKIGHYEIVSELGRGGMGVVYKAHEQSLNRYVAIKVLGQHLEEDSSYVQRFVREAQSAAKLNHPNIVQIYAISEEEGRHYFVMEYVTGTSLHSIIRSEGKLPAARAAHIVMQTASGLAAAHEMDIIHRDIKPANILITEKGLVKIADFGLALAVGGASRLTATGMFMGTPGYLSPEQCLDKTVDPRTDIYSLGITFYEMLTGAMPFKADSPLALLRQIIEVEPPDVRELNPEVDEPTRAIVQRMINKDPDQRYEDCGALIEDLQAYLEQSGVSRADLALLAAAAAPSPARTAPAPVETDRAVTLHNSPTMAVDSGGQPPPPPPSGPEAAAAPSPGEAPTELMAEPDAGPPPAPPATPSEQPEPEAIAPPPHSSSETRSRTPLLLLAAAAVILVAMLGGAAVAWKSGFLSRLLSKDQAPVSAQAAPGGLGTESSSDGAPENPEVPPTGELVAADSTQEGSADTSEAGSSAALEAAAAAGSGTAPVADSSSNASSTNRATAETAEPPRELTPPKHAAESGAPSSETSSERSVVTPRRQAERRPLPPAAEGVVVVATGERLLAGEAESFVQRFLGRRGVMVVDEARFPEVLDLLTQTDPTVTSLLASLEGKARRMVLVHAEYLGDRQLLHYGGRDVVYRSRLRIQPFELATGEAVGAGYDEVIEYNQLTVQRKVEEHLRRHIRDLLR